MGHVGLEVTWKYDTDTFIHDHRWLDNRFLPKKKSGCTSRGHRYGVISHFWADDTVGVTWNDTETTETEERGPDFFAPKSVCLPSELYDRNLLDRLVHTIGLRPDYYDEEQALVHDVSV